MWRELSSDEYRYLLQNSEKNKMVVGIFISAVQLLLTVVLVVNIINSIKPEGRVFLPGLFILILVVIGLQILRTRIIVVGKIDAYEGMDTVINDTAEYVNHGSGSYATREAVYYKVTLEGKETTISVFGSEAKYKPMDRVVVVREKGEKRITHGYKIIPEIK